MRKTVSESWKLDDFVSGQFDMRKKLALNYREFREIVTHASSLVLILP